MVKPVIKQRKGTTALPHKKSSWNPVDALTGKTNPRTHSQFTHSQSLSTDNSVLKTIKTQSSSVKSVAIASKIGSQSGDGEAPAPGQISHSRKVSKSKVVSHRSLGSTPRFPPPISRNLGGQGWYNNEMYQQEAIMFFTARHVNSHSLIEQLRPWGLWKSCSKICAAKVGLGAFTEPNGFIEDDSNSDPAASNILLGHHLNETDHSQFTPCNSCESLPVPEGHCCHDDSMVELEASQDELDKLNRDESTELSMERSQDSHVLKHQLHEKQKQVKKAKKQANIQHLCSQLAKTNHKLNMLRQKTLAQSTSGKSSSQPAAISTPQNASHQDQPWLQQVIWIQPIHFWTNWMKHQWRHLVTTIILWTSPVNHWRNENQFNLGSCWKSRSNSTLMFQRSHQTSHHMSP